MKNRKNNFEDFFDNFFGDSFSDSFFSSRRTSFNLLGNFDSGDSFPADDDENFSKTTEEVETGNHIIKKEVWISNDGSQRFERTTSQSKSAKSKPAELSKKDLQLMLDKAVEEQNYEEAIRLRDEMKKLE